VIRGKELHRGNKLIKYDDSESEKDNREIFSDNGNSLGTQWENRLTYVLPCISAGSIDLCARMIDLLR
jgi:hypothetical protein